VDRDVVTVTIDVPEPVTELGEKLAVVPVGTPFTLKLTLSPNPPLAVTVTWYDTLFPPLMLAEPGETPMAKSGDDCDCTTSVTVAV